MIRRWLALTYYLYALRLAALSHFYFNPLYLTVRILVERIQKQPVPLVSPKCRLLFAVRLLFNDGRSRRALVVNSNVVCD